MMEYAMKRFSAVILALCLMNSFAMANADTADAVDALRTTILFSPTIIQHSDTFIPGETYSGTAYYFSASEGDDLNDGLSPDTALASVCMIYSLNLHPGDAVFFKRGDIWRLIPGGPDPIISCVEGVTYSAYGEGAKPAFYGSPENGTGAEKWELVSEVEGKIWKFYRDMPDVGGIIVSADEVESTFTRAYGWWNGTEYEGVELNLNPNYKMDEFITYGWEVLSAPDAVMANHEFKSEIDYTGCEYSIRRYELCKQGPLYLRCDEGNPGELFTSLEFMTKELRESEGGWFGMINCAENVVVDNLAVKYYSDAAIRAEPGQNGIIVQNCEISYGGNCIHEFIGPEPTRDFMLSGDGIYGMAKNAVVRSNYVHDVDGGGITFETYTESEDADVGTYTAQGNLVERCGGGIQLNDGNAMLHFDEIDILDNIIIDMGGGWTHNCLGDISSICIGGWGEVLAEKINVIGNYLSGSRMYLLLLWNENVQLSGNEYYADNAFLCIPPQGWRIIRDADEMKMFVIERGETDPVVAMID